MARFSSTLSALAAPRRSVPIALVVASLVGVQLYYSGDARTALIPGGMAVAFCALAPWSWRVLLRSKTSPMRMGLYALEALAAVAVFGVALPVALALGPTFLTDAGSLVIAGVLYAIGGWGLGRDIELESNLEHTRHKAVRTHLDPHFLYNTLNAIAEWCAEDPRVAEEATLRLGQMLRAIVEGLERVSWPLAREVALVEDLLELHRIRDAEAFTVAIDVDPAVTTAEVPPMLVVSLVENAVKHGPRAGHRGVIALRIADAAGGVHVTVENPGPFAPAPAHAGRGLASVHARLALAYGRAARFAIAATATGTRATIELPARLR
jgi:hypothetical protein